MQPELVFSLGFASLAAAIAVAALFQISITLASIELHTKLIRYEIEDQLADYVDGAPDMIALLGSTYAPPPTASSAPLTTRDLDKVLGSDLAAGAVARELGVDLSRPDRTDPTFARRRAAFDPTAALAAQPSGIGVDPLGR